MLTSKNRKSSLWRKSTNTTNKTQLKTTLDEIFDMSELKTATKRISIKSRLEDKTLRSQGTNRKNKSNTYIKQNIESISEKRPQTSQAHKINTITSAQKAYMAEKKINEKLLNEEYSSQYKSTNNSNIKEGLLGEYTRYQEMPKQELIEKLISLEYLANTIFKRNKYLEQKLKQVNLEQNN